MSVRLQLCKGLTEAGISLICLAGQCWQEASVPPHMNLSIGLIEYPHIMVAGFSQSK